LVIAAVIFLLPPARDPLEVRKATLASIVAIATHRRLYRLQIHMRGGIFRYVGAAQIERRANLPRGKCELLHRPFVSSV